MPMSPALKRALHRACRNYLRDRVDHLAARERFARRIRANAEHGMVAVVYGFIDCDGGRADNIVTLVPANVPALDRWYDDFASNAEGPQWSDLAKPSEVADLESDHRDLALEAFEDGHSHVLYA